MNEEQPAQQGEETVKRLQEQRKKHLCNWFNTTQKLKAAKFIHPTSKNPSTSHPHKKKSPPNLHEPLSLQIEKKEKDNNNQENTKKG